MYKFSRIVEFYCHMQGSNLRTILQILDFGLKKKKYGVFGSEERISPIDIVEEYNQYTTCIYADTYVVPDMVDGFLWFVFFFFFSNFRTRTIEKRRFFRTKKYRALFFNGMTLCIIIALFMIIRKPCERVYSARLKSRLRYDEYDGKYFYNTERLVPASGYYNEEKPPDQTLASFWS